MKLAELPDYFLLQLLGDRDKLPPVVTASVRPLFIMKIAWWDRVRVPLGCVQRMTIRC
jgi:hypothetical protein